MDDVAPSLGRKLAFSALAARLFAVLLAALGEAALRWVPPKSDGVKSGVALEGAARLFGFRPGYRLLQTGVVVQTNLLGSRENEYPVERRPGVRRIVVLGDSFTFGTGVSFRRSTASASKPS
jgi:hypothetical protein